jgi:hypothetical protein
MRVIDLKGTDDTPKVLLDAENDIMEISGRSLPEDVSSFYKPILDWVKEYTSTPNPSTIFRFKLVYFNTASSKNIMSILTALKELHIAGKPLLIDWFYHEDDEEMQESGVEFERIVKIPFKHRRFSD